MFSANPNTYILWRFEHATRYHGPYNVGENLNPILELDSRYVDMVLSEHHSLDNVRRNVFFHSRGYKSALCSLACVIEWFNVVVEFQDYDPEIDDYREYPENVLIRFGDIHHYRIRAYRVLAQDVVLDPRNAKQYALKTENAQIVEDLSVTEAFIRAGIEPVSHYQRM